MEIGGPTKPKWYGFFQGLHAPWKIPGGLHSLSGMVFSRGLMTPGKFQEVTEALMAWIFPGGLEISRGPWKFPGGYRNLGGMVFSRGHGNFQGVLEKSREPPYFTLVTE